MIAIQGITSSTNRPDSFERGRRGDGIVRDGFNTSAWRGRFAGGTTCQSSIRRSITTSWAVACAYFAMKLGFEDAAWEAAKTEAKAVLADYARRCQTVPYSDFVARLRSIDLEPHDFQLRE